MSRNRRHVSRVTYVSGLGPSYATWGRRRFSTGASFQSHSPDLPGHARTRPSRSSIAVQAPRTRFSSFFCARRRSPSSSRRKSIVLTSFDMGQYATMPPRSETVHGNPRHVFDDPRRVESNPRRVGSDLRYASEQSETTWGGLREP